MSLVWNNYGWDQVSNLIYVDQPTGTGFRSGSDSWDLRQDEDGVSNDLYDFLQAFFAEHPQFVNNDFFITGESYAGHYIPPFASRVNQGNKAKEGIHINLKGFAIGNGLTDPAVQYNAYTDYALGMKIIGQSDHDSINKMLPECEQAIQDCGTNGKDDCLRAFSLCNDIFNSIMSITGFLVMFNLVGCEVGVISASPLAMGLLIHNGPPEWHPAPPELKVEITCRGQPVDPALHLYDLVDLWLQSTSRSERIHATVGSSAKDFVMVLAY